ncbi:hypothetical protein [Marinigracilibium pacificum]|uniref:Uncharacterized protein n=1 Tax=Marinigracilibium pacificum TaxID=2729599 RepID=A0A848IYY6_9BACT|nr:hypothetical protein [Marinigracilibium pacificum]NMM48368.1 hypothetical protein [Marinigracilibium pacificum]
MSQEAISNKTIPAIAGWVFISIDPRAGSPSGNPAYNGLYGPSATLEPGGCSNF